MTNIWYAAGDAGLVSVQEPTVTRMQVWYGLTEVADFQVLEKLKDSVWYKIPFSFYD